VFDEVISDEIV
jgi:hypothetical protein